MATLPNSSHNGAPEAIAIVGMSCRFSGTATSPESLWQMLSKGLTGWANNASGRFRMDAFWHPQADLSGSFNTRGLHLLKQNPAFFDNGFFGISNIEAKAIDPQHRMMLEVAYEAFEDAGVPMHKLAGSDTAVFCAISNHDYEKILSRDPEVSPGYRFTGTGPSMLANRVSYFFDLHGPSVTLDTACSSGLVALHEACKAIRDGEVSQALVGGSNLILDPDQTTVMSSMSFLSPHGRCYSFDDRADGFGRGEGVAAVMLKSLDQALRDGDSIRAVIRGSGVVQDGRTPGITMPSCEAQMRMIKKVYEKANLNPRDTPYVEAHGTGTTLGDKIEASALRGTFCEERGRGKLLVGSVKSNIGHTESVAGLAGVIKTVLVLEKGLIPPNPTFVRPSDQLPLHNWNMDVPTNMTKWPENTVRRASVNSFGYGGTNGHVILEAAEEYIKRDSRQIGVGNSREVSRPRLFVLSHAVESGLGEAAASLKKFVSGLDGSNKDLNSLAFTLSRRSSLDYKFFVSASTQEELIEGLDKQASGQERVFSHVKHPSVCFAFSGQGAQWPGMGRELLLTNPVFAMSMKRSEQTLLQLGADWRLIEELCKQDHSRINEAVLSQPACTAVQIALVDMLKSWNILPNGVVGHSSGEIAAAYAAGMLSAEAALKAAYHRGESVLKLKQKYPKLRGAMLAAGLSASDAQRYLLGSADIGKAVIACENSPGSVTISGDETAVSVIQEALNTNQIFNRKLVVDAAYHSHHMELVQPEYWASIQDITCGPRRQNVSMISSVDGQEVQGRTLDAKYWCRNLTSPVRFVDAVAGIVRKVRDKETRDPVVIVEIGPHSALAGPIKQILKAENLQGVDYLSVLTRKQDASNTATSAAGQLFQRGYRDLNFDAINDPYGDAEKCVLPDISTYSWTHKTPLWSESRRSLNYRLRKFARHDLLGTLSIDSICEQPTWRNYISLQEQPWLVGHSIADSIIFPAAGYLSMALEGLKQMTLNDDKPWKNMRIKFRQIHFESALIIPEDSAVETILSMRPHSAKDSWKEFRVFSISSNGASTEHCRGLASVESQSSRQRDLTDASSEAFVKEVSKDSQIPIDPVKLYRELDTVGLHYTGLFANQKQMRASQSGAACRIEIPDAKSTMPAHHQQSHCIHPSTLDLCIQSVFPIMKAAGLLGSSVVVSTINSLEVHSEIPARPGQELDVATKLRQYGRSKVIADSVVTGTRGINPPAFMKIKGLVLASSGGPLHPGASQRPEGQSLTHRLEWSIDPTFAEPETIFDHCQLSRTELTSYGLNSVCEDYTRTLIQRTIASLDPNDKDKIKGHYSKLLHWMQANSNGLNSTSIKDCGKEIEARVQAAGAHGETLVHIGPHLAGVLRGEVDGLDLLKQNDRLYSLYNYDNYDRGHRQLAKYVQLLQFKNPNMRILEIGAGTASTTMPVLEALSTMSNCAGKPKLDQYTFTDISTGFFEKAEAKLEKFQDVLEFKKLDIEVSPGQQGIKEGSYDLVIATNVLHATRDIEHTLMNVRRLLKPDGHLALMEFTVTTLYTGLIFGMLPGWWLSADGRQGGPLLDVARWDESLRMCGFTGVDVELPDYENEEHEMSLLISAAGRLPDLPHNVQESPPARLSLDSDSIGSFEEVQFRALSPGRQEVVTPISSISTEDCDSAQAIQIVHGFAEERVANKLCKMLGEYGVSATQVDLSTLQPDGQLVVVLLELIDPFLATCSELDWEKIRQTCQLANGVLWATTGAAVECANPMRSLITGLARCLQSENHAIRFTTLDLETKSDLDTTLEWETNVARHICNISRRTLSPHSLGPFTEWEFAIREGKVLIPRVVEDIGMDGHIRDSVSEFHPRYEKALKSGRALGLSIQVPGLLDTLFWKDSKKHSRGVGAEEVRVEMAFMSLNFKDIMVAMGQLDGHTTLLLEGSGRVIEVGDSLAGQFAIGDLVYVHDFDGLATTSNIHASMVHQLSAAMNLETAAATGIAFATALYSLEDAGKLQEGESILIHSGAGAVGQAAITLAQKVFKAGEIYVTVGSDEKRDFIKEKFGIPESNIFSSRGIGFHEDILRQTKGEGVDVVLNSLSGEALQKSIELLAPLGRFVEIGKKDMISPETRLEMWSLEKNIQFSSVDLTLVGRKRSTRLNRILRRVFEFLAEEKISAINPIKAMPVSQLEEACRLMQAGKHIGKLLLDLDREASIYVQPPKPSAPKLKPNSSYLVVGGTGGLGKATLRLLADLGAKRIVTLSRSGSDSPSVRDMVAEMSARGVEVIVHKGSVLDKGTIETLKDACKDYPVRGVVQGAMVLRDSRVENMTYEDWRTAMEPKVHGTWNLHDVFGRSLDFFILLSSSGGVIGSFSQGNYCAGNTFQDAFARYRAGLGLPGRSINVGFVEGEGYTAENEAAAEFVRRQGLTSYKLEEYLATVQEAIIHPVAMMPSEAQLLCGISRADPSSGTPEAALQRPDSKFSHIWRKETHQEQRPAQPSGQIDIQAVLSASESPQEAIDATIEAMKMKLARLLAVPIDDIRVDRSIASYGMDSLIAVELRNWVSTLLEAQVQMFELMSSMPFADLAALIAKRSRLVAMGVFEKEKSSVK